MGGGGDVGRGAGGGGRSCVMDGQAQLTSTTWSGVVEGTYRRHQHRRRAGHVGGCLFVMQSIAWDGVNNRLLG
jgi:hypothetical protein